MELAPKGTRSGSLVSPRYRIARRHCFDVLMSLTMLSRLRPLADIATAPPHAQIEGYFGSGSSLKRTPLAFQPKTYTLYAPPLPARPPPVTTHHSVHAIPILYSHHLGSYWVWGRHVRRVTSAPGPLCSRMLCTSIITTHLSRTRGPRGRGGAANPTEPTSRLNAKRGVARSTHAAASP